jgi:hypothetical protein
MLLSIQSTAESILNNAEHNPSIYLTILFALFELFVRLRPTSRNLSILARIVRIINVILPNYSKDKAIEEAGKIIKKKFPY